MMDFSEIILRLVAATLMGAAIGLNRDLRGKPTGIRTLGLVALGSALIVLATAELSPPSIADWSAASRTIQGIITGIGFLGAGVIIRDQQSDQIRGLTTAACIWLTSCIGIICGLGAWKAALVALPLVFVILTVGGPIETALHRRWGHNDDPLS